MPFIRTSKGVHGPFSAEHLKALHRRGKLPADAEYSNTADGPWRKVPALRIAAPPVVGPPQPRRSASISTAGAIAIALTLLCGGGVCVAIAVLALPRVLRTRTSGSETADANAGTANSASTLTDASQPVGVAAATSTAAATQINDQPPSSSATQPISGTEATARSENDDPELESGPRPEALDSHMANLKQLTTVIRGLAKRCEKKDIRAFLFLTLSDFQYQWLAQFDNSSIRQHLSSTYDWNSYVDSQGRPQNVVEPGLAYLASSPNQRHKKLGLNTAESKKVLQAESDLIMSLQGGEVFVFGGPGWLSEAKQFFALFPWNRQVPKLMRGEVEPGYEWVVNQSGQFDTTRKQNDQYAAVETACVRFGQMVSDSCDRLDTVLDSLMTTQNGNPEH